MTTREGIESIIQKENCFVEEIKEVELRSRGGKFIYNRTCNYPVGLNKVLLVIFHDMVVHLADY